MSNPQALLDCTFSWGKTCRLYCDSIEIAGRSYDLDDLTYIQPTYRTMFGVSSARLELCFGLRRLTLRGIPDPETVRQMVSHLLPYAEHTGPATLSHRVRSRTTQARDLVRAQAKAWERTNKIPALLDVPQPSTPAPERPETISVAQPVSPSESAHAFDDFLDFSEQPTSHIPTNASHGSGELAAQTSESTSEQATAPDPLTLPDQPTSPIPSGSLSSPLQLTEIAPTDLLPVSEPPAVLSLADALPASEPATATPLVEGPVRLLPGAKTRPVHLPRLQPPLRSVQLVNPEQKTLETGSMPVPALKSSVLPIIHVPVRLQPGECAHYSIGAALCSDRLAGSERAPYPPLDHGLLILTNRRLFYLGKRCQLILAYTHLWYVSLLHNAIALHIEGQFRRIIMEVEHPQEWAGRIEQIAYIARRSRPRAEQSASFVLPGLKALSTLPVTVKRAALQLPTTKEEKATPEAASTPAPVAKIDQHVVEANTIELSLQADPRIVEANTIEFDLPVGPRVVEADTIELDLQADPSIIEANTIEFDLHTTHRFADMVTCELAPLGGEKATRGGTFSPHPWSDYAAMKTIELQKQNTQEDADTRSFYEPDEETTSKLEALSNSNQAQQENVETRILSFGEPDEEATGKLATVLRHTQAELGERETDHLSLQAQSDPENEDEITVPLRRRKIAAIGTHPLRPKQGQPATDLKIQHTPQSRALSRPRFLKAEG